MCSRGSQQTHVDVHWRCLIHPFLFEIRGFMPQIFSSAYAHSAITIGSRSCLLDLLCNVTTFCDATVTQSDGKQPLNKLCNTSFFQPTTRFLQVRNKKLFSFICLTSQSEPQHFHCTYLLQGFAMPSTYKAIYSLNLTGSGK